MGVRGQKEISGWPSRRGYLGSFVARPQDLWMLIMGGRTDSRLAALRAHLGDRAAFEAIYRDGNDPWSSLDPRFSYQRRKYEIMMALLPPGRNFGRALDLGCGLGVLSRLLVTRADYVLGLDVAQSAVEQARLRHGGTANLHFERGDILDCQATEKFDLIMIADTLYYLPSTSDAALDDVAAKIAGLLAPGGICVLSNHLFAFGWDEATRLSRRIHKAFCRSPHFRLVSKHWRPFFLTTLLGVSPAP